jgi:aryl-alcohol dehydrogenase-like predicted oxidoreductase
VGGHHLEQTSATRRFETSGETFKTYASERANKIARVVVDTAKEIGCSPAQLAIAWLQHQSPRRIPLLVARSVQQLQDNLGSVNVKLSSKILGRLDGATKIHLGYPSNFFSFRHDGWFKHLSLVSPCSSFARRTA